MLKEVVRHIRNIVGDFIRFFIIFLPGGTGRKLRYFYYKRKFKRCGRNVTIDEGVIIDEPAWTSLGDNVWIGRYCTLMAGKVNLVEKIHKRKENRDFIGEEGELIIGSNVELAPYCVVQGYGGVYIGNNSALSSGVKIFSLSNLTSNPKDTNDIINFTPMSDKSAYIIGPIVLKENVGVALNGIILSGVSIGENSFVTPNSVLMKSFEQNSYIAGNPAKKIKDRFTFNKKND